MSERTKSQTLVAQDGLASGPLPRSCATVRCSHPAKHTVMSHEGRWEWLDRFCSQCAVKFVSEGAARWLTLDERVSVNA